MLARARARRQIVGVLIISVPFVVGSALLDNGSHEHASAVYYAVSGVVILATVAATIAGYVLGSKIANSAVRPLPRWLYLLLGVACLAPVALFVRAAIGHVRDHTANQGGWEPMAAGLTATACAIAALLMFGRAMAWGRLRRAFWILPPRWLDQAPAIPP